MRADRRLWRTPDGNLVDDGHPQAAFLAYAVGDELADTDAASVARPDAKQVAPAENKARKPAGNKAG